MRQILFLGGLVSLILGSCKKDTAGNVFPGFYIETSPVPGRSHLNFITSNLVVRSEPAGSSIDTFNYSFSTDTIILTATFAPQYSPTKLYFRKIDEISFQIANLYPGIPEFSPSYMTYKKKNP